MKIWKGWRKNTFCFAWRGYFSGSGLQHYCPVFCFWREWTGQTCQSFGKNNNPFLRGLHGYTCVALNYMFMLLHIHFIVIKASRHFLSINFCCGEIFVEPYSRIAIFQWHSTKTIFLRESLLTIPAHYIMCKSLSHLKFGINPNRFLGSSDWTRLMMKRTLIHYKYMFTVLMQNLSITTDTSKWDIWFKMAYSAGGDTIRKDEDEKGGTKEESDLGGYVSWRRHNSGRKIPVRSQVHTVPPPQGAMAPHYFLQPFFLLEEEQREKKSVFLKPTQMFPEQSPTQILPGCVSP